MEPSPALERGSHGFKHPKLWPRSRLLSCVPLQTYHAKAHAQGSSGLLSLLSVRKLPPARVGDFDAPHSDRLCPSGRALDRCSGEAGQDQLHDHVALEAMSAHQRVGAAVAVSSKHLKSAVLIE